MPNPNLSAKIPRRGRRCPPAERLAAYIDGLLIDEQKQSVERHLADCAYCRKSVAGAVSHSEQPAPPTPAWLRQRAEALAGQSKSKHWRWAWALVPALACLVAVVVLIQSPPASHMSPAISAHPPAAQTGGAGSAPTRSLSVPREPLRLLAPASGALVAPNRLRFAWSAMPDAASYRIRITTTEGALVWQARSEQPKAQAPPTLKIAPGNYFAWVTAYLQDGREQQSAPVEFRVQAER